MSDCGCGQGQYCRTKFAAYAAIFSIITPGFLKILGVLGLKTRYKQVAITTPIAFAGILTIQSLFSISKNNHDHNEYVVHKNKKDLYNNIPSQDFMVGTLDKDNMTALQSGSHMFGDTGDDLYIGGPGQDYFYFDLCIASNAISLIKNFNPKNDTIRLFCDTENNINANDLNIEYQTAFNMVSISYMERIVVEIEQYKEMSYCIYDYNEDKKSSRHCPVEINVDFSGTITEDDEFESL